MNKILFKITVWFLVLNILPVYAQIGIGTPTPHEKASLHLAENEKALVLNRVYDRSNLSNPQEGMIFYDKQDECFRGYANGEFTDCFGLLSPDPVVRVDGPGFKGTFVRGQNLTDATFEVTITNNTFNPVEMGFHINDLLLDNSDITVSSVYLYGNNNTSTTQFNLNLVSGATKTIVYKLNGTPSAPYIQIAGVWSKVNLEYQNIVNVKYNLDCSNGNWETPITPYPVNGLQNGVTYSGVYKITYNVDATGFTFYSFSQTSNGITMIGQEEVGEASGEILIHLSGTYNSTTSNNFIFLPPYGCTISFSTPKNCKEILALLPTSQSDVYQIDVDGNGSLQPFDCYCDMVTDGGGWTLVLNYNHLGGTNPNLNILNDRLPLLSSSNLGVDQSNLNGKKYWGHFSNSLASKMSFNEIRFYGISNSKQNQISHVDVRAKGNDGRVLHFKTSLPRAISYVKTGSGSMLGLNTSYILLDGHTAHLPASINNHYENQGNYALTEFPFYETGTTHWGVRGFPGTDNRWEVDDFPRSPNFNTYHQVWIR